MTAYLIRRSLAVVLTLFGISIVIFLLMRLVPGTIVQQLLGSSALASKEMIDKLRHFFGLDQPLYIQYFSWVKGLPYGDFGVSWRSGNSVLKLIIDRFGVSGEIAVLSIAWSLLIGIPLGSLAAIKRKTLTDSNIRFFSVIGLSVPAFWQGTIFILIFSIYLRWSPSFEWVSFFENPLENLKLIALPVLSLGTANAALTVRLTRSSMLEILSTDYTKTARSKGLSEKFVILKHALKNALVPIITVAGVQIGYILGGTVVVEKVFSLPGMGRLLVDTMIQRDYPVVQGIILVYALIFVMVNFIVDILYGFIDPRIRYE